MVYRYISVDGGEKKKVKKLAIIYKNSNKHLNHKKEEKNKSKVKKDIKTQ